MFNFKAFQPINLRITWVMRRITVKLKNGHWSNNLVLGSCLFRHWTTDLGFWLHWSLTAEDFSCCFGWPSSGSFAYEGPRGRVESGRRLSYEIYESTMEKPCDNWGERFGDRDDLAGGFKCFLSSPLLGDDFQFDEYFSNRVKPPTSDVFSYKLRIINNPRILKINQNHMVDVNLWLPSRKLTYPPKMAFWRWFSFSQGGIC